MNSGYPEFNGHLVIKGFPENRLLMTRGGATVCLSLDCKSSVTGKAKAYVHNKCCQKVAIENGVACYDILLLDSEYSLYYAGNRRSSESNIKISPEELCDMAAKTRENEIKNKNREVPVFAITSQYCNEEKFPYDVNKTNQ